MIFFLKKIMRLFENVNKRVYLWYEQKQLAMKNDVYSPGFAGVPVKDFSKEFEAVQAERDKLVKRLFDLCLEVNEDTENPYTANLSVFNSGSGQKGSWIGCSLWTGGEKVKEMMSGPSLTYPGCQTRVDWIEVHSPGYRLSMEEACNRAMSDMIGFLERICERG